MIKQLNSCIYSWLMPIFATFYLGIIHIFANGRDGMIAD